MKVWVAVVEHRHGQNVYAAKTKKALVGQLYEYVAEWWASQIPDEEMPTDLPRKEVVDRYFECVGHEWLETLTQTTVSSK